MKSADPAHRKLRFARTRQRVASLLLLAVFAWLIWAAYSGRYDAQVQQLADWLQSAWQRLTR
ncbi:hypothetical protein [Rehaibacterium terrae]|uniref:Uncharacterized protein n=1 Tax=Rehaibacterium terrae TaxID=1341696 RepID=A0A7W8DDR8_9GAMM|nr:hypothetical protein [Rehaibacterium terrae]MBB5015301.1 hypothetical protein [Rehaibacterium terrae]